MELTNLVENTIEDDHFFDVHLGETLVPYGTLTPLKALLPVRQSAETLSKNANSSDGIDPRSLGRRMQQRWAHVNQVWDDNKTLANRLKLLERLDYFGNLACQFEWKNGRDVRPIRLVYASAGVPTAAILRDDSAIVDYKLFWVPCASMNEAQYLLAIINSDILYAAASPLMSKGQWGARDLQKHLWRLAIPEFDARDATHAAISDAGRQVAVGVERELERLREARPGFTVTIARREIRKWLRESAEGQRVEEVVGVLLGG